MKFLAHPSRWALAVGFAARAATGRLLPGEFRGAATRLLIRAPIGDTFRRRLLLASRRDAFAARDAYAHAWPRHLYRPEPSSGKSKPDVFILALIDWHFRIQRPQHLARALACRGHRVFYVSNEFRDTGVSGFDPELLDSNGRLYQVHLHVRDKQAIYHAMPNQAQADDIRNGLKALLAWTGTTEAISLVHHPFWMPFTGDIPNVRVVYDCMDHLAGFDENAADVIEAERQLVEQADLVVVTSSWLAAKFEGRARRVETIRNAGEYARFAERPRTVFRDPAGRHVIGYHGAIATWFDIELVERVAHAFPDALVLLVGADTAGAASRLSPLSNVQMTGEVPYDLLPYWVHGFDVGLLPFRITDLTLATNPVKVYEYLAAGLPAVCVDLPELAEFDGLVRVAGDPIAFIEAVRVALNEGSAERIRTARKAFAAHQTWERRADALAAALLD